MSASTLAVTPATPTTGAVQTFALPTWQRDVPPPHGVPILALGHVTQQWNAHTVVMPFARAIRYEFDCAEPCWVDFYSRLSLAEEASDAITIHAWMYLPSLADFEAAA